jgi:deoxyadenosine/deoxycytidine kinase
MNRRYAIEGSLGVGKTSVIDKICKSQKGRVLGVPEPVGVWMKTGSGGRAYNLLGHYYTHPDFAPSFQTLVVVTLFQAFTEAVKVAGGKHILCERSMWSGGTVFSRVSAGRGYMNPEEMAVIYYSTSALVAVSGGDLFEKIFYIRASPETCLRRVRERGRGGEEEGRGVSLEYLRVVDVEYERWLKEKFHPNRTTAGIVVIDGEQSSDAIAKEIEKHIFG